MNVKSIKFDRYAIGDTEFSPELMALASEETRAALQALIERLIHDVFDPENGGHTAILVAGFADRDQDSGTCDEKRERERVRARDRGWKAWVFLRDAVTAGLIAAGLGADPGEWWNDSPVMTWALVFAGSGQPIHEAPANDLQRAENRRVHFLVSQFP